MPSFRKVLVANRGEIAIRVFRTLRELGIGAVGVYSEADRGSLHVASADEAYLLGPGAPAESYLHQERVLDARGRPAPTRSTPATASSPRTPSFARAVEERRPRLDRAAAGGDRGDGLEGEGAAADAGRPGCRSSRGRPSRSSPSAEVLALGEEHGWPLAIKASAGGGGKGLKVVRSPEEAERALASAQREGEAYFADATVYVERFLEDPRHVEVQVLADAHGTVVHLGERDCTIQRRHQKLVEETPSPAVGPELRERIGAIAVDAARAVGYRGAGTIEGLLDREGNYFFLEMNTRIQVEHTVTELVTGIDLVREQVLVAAGEPLSFAQEDVRFSGHAIECRINAEDRGRRLPADARDDHRLPRAGRAGRPGRLRRDGGLRRSSASTTRSSPSSSSGTPTASAPAAACCARSTST